MVAGQRVDRRGGAVEGRRHAEPSTTPWSDKPGDAKLERKLADPAWTASCHRPCIAGAEKRRGCVNSDLQHRPIRSFVLRQGRFSTGAARSLRHASAALRHPVFAGPHRPRGRVRARRIRRSWKSASAWARRPRPSRALQPEHDFLAVDVHAPGVGSLLRLIEPRAPQQRSHRQSRCRRGRRNG